MTETAKVGLLANLNRCKAQQIIHLGKYDPTDFRGVFALYLQAGYPLEIARKAQSRAAELLADQRVEEARRARTRA